MNIVVIGLGSMGRRRIRLLKQYAENNLVNDWRILGVDFSTERCAEVAKLFEIETFMSISEVNKVYKIDAAVISTSPLSHAAIIEDCLKREMHIFTELNLVDTGYESNKMLAIEKNKLLFLSSTFLYRKEIKYIKDKIAEAEFVGMYRYHIGQYLPSWHPWESYKNFFVADKRTNGCREILAIELPWLIECFGKINKVSSIHKKISSLEVNYDDSYQIILEHESGTIGCLNVDIVTPRTCREFEMWMENFCITWNGTPDTLLEYNEEKNEMRQVVLYDNIDHQAAYNQYIVENAYYDELDNYIGSILGKEKPMYSFEQDWEILKLIDEIER